MKRVILFAMILLSLLAASCGTSPPSPSTRIDPATVNLEDHFKDQGRGDEHTVKIHVDPSRGRVEPVVPPATVYNPPAPIPTATTRPAPAIEQPIIVPTTLPSGASEIKLGTDRSIVVPAGSAVDVDIHDEIHPQQTSHDRTASSAGPTLRTDKDAGNFNASAPQVSLGTSDDVGSAGGGTSGSSATGKGGSLDYSWTTLVNAVSAASTGQKWLWGIGILFIVAAVGMIVVEHIFGGTADWALFGLLVAGGIGFITVGIVSEKYPVFFLLLAIGAIAGVVWYVVYWKKREAKPSAPTA